MSTDATEAEAGLAAVDSTPTIDHAKAEAMFAQLVKQQNFPLGVASGFVAALAGGAAWAAVTVATGYQIGWMAIGIGFLVGIAVRATGKGLTKSFGYAGGALALFGCLLGNFLTMCGLVAIDSGASIVTVTLAIASQPAAVLELMTATFSPMDLLFYGIAVYEGYKFSFRQIDDSELNAMLG